MNLTSATWLAPLQGFTPPGIEDFQFGPLWHGAPAWVNKPLVLAIIATIVVLAFWVWVSRDLKLVPGKKQFLGEYLYEFIRNGVARDMLGPGYRPYVPYFVGLFSFVLVNNWFEEFFLFMFPTMSNIGYAWALVAITLVMYIAAGFRKHGLGYIKHALVPAGVPAALLILIIPIEFLSNFITRPLTLGVRLFANMFAGHLSILVFTVGGTFLLTYAHNIFYNVAGFMSIVFVFAIFALELFVGAIQAYIFTVLTAQYVASSIADEH